MTQMTPIMTTVPLGSIPSGSYGVQIGPAEIYIGGDGVHRTAAFRPLSDAEVAELTHVLPFLFDDMVEEYEKEHPPTAP